MVNVKEIESYWKDNQEEHDRVYQRFYTIVKPFIELESEQTIELIRNSSINEEILKVLNYEGAWIAFQIGWIEGKLSS